jgi:chemotaxis protein MotB
MARHKQQEEHENHERWAIPYGDLVTLLLAFFVVMYSISQVNEGKYRVLSDSLNAAFRGTPSTPVPVQVGAPAATMVAAPIVQLEDNVQAMAMRQLTQQAQDALQPLIQQGLVDVTGGDGKLSIAIRSDILFSSGSADPSAEIRPVILQLGEVLRGFPVDVRVEGHTDDVPVATRLFPSNWELSAARSASVVRLLVEGGVVPEKLSVVAFGEHHPVAPNATADGRNANRRVVLLVESAPVSAVAPPSTGTATPADSTVPPEESA